MNGPSVFNLNPTLGLARRVAPLLCRRFGCSWEVRRGYDWCPRCGASAWHLVDRDRGPEEEGRRPCGGSFFPWSRPGRHVGLDARADAAGDEFALDAPEGSSRAEARLAQIEALTDTALAHLSVEALLDELLERVRSILDVDTAAVLLLDQKAGVLVATAARGLEEEVRQGVTVPLNAGFAGRIAAERGPIVIDRVDETTVVNPLLIAKGIQTMAGVPLVDAGEVVGVLHVGSLRPRSFTTDDIDLLQLVADRLTGATGTRLVTADRDATIALQRALLPGRLPEVPGLRMSARYVPGSGNAIGGDWYDVFLLNGGRVGIVIGDVAGHGLDAAIVMGRARSALRAYALDSTDPAIVLTRLDAKLKHFEAGAMATVLYGVLEPAFRTLRIACAGHLPPIVASPQSGGAQRLDLLVDPPIGVATRAPRRVTDIDLTPGVVLCFYTDGLVERRGRDIDEGMDLLCSSVRLASPPAVSAEVMAALVGTTVLDDDVAILVVETVALGAEQALVLQLPAEPAVLAAIRSAMRRWLAGTPASDREAEDLLVASGEAVANAVEHAYGPDGGTIDLRSELLGDRVVITVRDRGQWRSPRGQDRGRGEMLMRALCDDVVVTKVDGTTVRLEMALGTR